MDGVGSEGLGGDDLLLAKGSLSVGVFVPGDCVTYAFGDAEEDIQVAVAVEVGGVDGKGPPAWVVMTCWSPKVPCPSVFSYQAILSSSRTRRGRPCRRRRRGRRRRWSGQIRRRGDDLLLAERALSVGVFVPGDPVVDASDAERTSKSPSPSRSAA